MKSPTVGSHEGAVSYERGTPVLHRRARVGGRGRDAIRESRPFHTFAPRIGHFCKTVINYADELTQTPAPKRETAHPKHQVPPYTWILRDIKSASDAQTRNASRIFDHFQKINSLLLI